MSNPEESINSFKTHKNTLPAKIKYGFLKKLKKHLAGTPSVA